MIPGASDKSSADADEAALDRALAMLPSYDLDPLAARALSVAITARLGGAKRIRSWYSRYEPITLIALAIAQLLWALARVFARAL